MNPNTNNLVAFLAVLVVIAVLSFWGKSDLAVVTGLVGILGSFRPWGMGGGPAGTKDDPLAIEGAADGKKRVPITEGEG